jgi:adapter protein MecA 1/2
MKIERINENQIKCTLSKHDLASRQIKVSELAYGTEKAKLLFRDMIQQAASELGFHAEDFPLMIEAIPIPGDSIILIITKVEDPEELDARFSNFSAEDFEEDDDYEIDEEYMEDMEDIIDDSENGDSLIDMFNHVREKLEELSSTNKEFIPLADLFNQAAKARENVKSSDKSVVQPVTRVFSFDNLDTIIYLSTYLQGYQSENSLYKSTKDNRYYLIMNNSSQSVQEFSMVCNVVSEFGRTEEYSSVGEAYYKEHFDKIIEKSALRKLQLINHTGGFQDGTDN